MRNLSPSSDLGSCLSSPFARRPQKRMRNLSPSSDLGEVEQRRCSWTSSRFYPAGSAWRRRCRFAPPSVTESKTSFEVSRWFFPSIRIRIKTRQLWLSRRHLPYQIHCSIRIRMSLPVWGTYVKGVENIGAMPHARTWLCPRTYVKMPTHVCVFFHRNKWLFSWNA